MANLKVTFLHEEAERSLHFHVSQSECIDHTQNIGPSMYINVWNIDTCLH